MVANGHGGTGDALSASTYVTGASGATSATSWPSDCCPQRFPTHTGSLPTHIEARERQKKERRKKNNPVPPWLRPRAGREL